MTLNLHQLKILDRAMEALARIAEENGDFHWGERESELSGQIEALIVEMERAEEDGQDG